MHNLIPVCRFILQEDLDAPQFMEERLEQLIELDEVRTEAQKQNENLQL